MPSSKGARLKGKVMKDKKDKKPKILNVSNPVAVECQRWLETKNESIYALAKLAGIDYSTLWHTMYGVRNLSQRKTIDLCTKVLNQDLTYAVNMYLSQPEIPEENKYKRKKYIREDLIDKAEDPKVEDPKP